MKPSITIAGRKIGEGRSCFVIAEAGVNHNGDVVLAKQLVDAARRAGADAVKFQTWRSEKVIAASAPKAAYQKETTGADESQLEMVKKLELPPSAFRQIAAHAEQAGILFLSTPFDNESVDDLQKLGMAAFKVPSGEITNFPLLAHVARQRKPVIMSTGMANLDEVKTAVRVLRRAGTKQLALLHCVSNYPAQPASANLRAMETMRRTFRLPVGYSDHTMGIEIALAAVALGACIIEKHLTLDRNLPGPDHTASLEPEQFAALVQGIRAVEAARGDGRKRRMPEEEDVARVARRSLVLACDVAAGARLRAEHIVMLRPGTGMPPASLRRALGKKARRELAAGTLLAPGMLR